MTATPCLDCPLRALPLFLPHTDEELALLQQLKRRELVLHEGETLIHEGEADTRLYTLLQGWGVSGLPRHLDELTAACAQVGGDLSPSAASDAAAIPRCGCSCASAAASARP